MRPSNSLKKLLYLPESEGEIMSSRKYKKNLQVLNGNLVFIQHGNFSLSSWKGHGILDTWSSCDLSFSPVGRKESSQCSPHRCHRRQSRRGTPVSLLLGWGVLPTQTLTLLLRIERLQMNRQHQWLAAIGMSFLEERIKSSTSHCCKDPFSSVYFKI